MVRRSRWFADKVVLSAIGLILSTALIGAGLLAQQREQTLQQGQRLAGAFAAVIAEQTSRSLQTIDQQIELLAKMLDRIRADGDTEASGASSLLHAQVDALPFIANVMVLDAQGKVSYASSAELRGVDLAAKDFATVYKTRPGTGFYIGTPMLNRDGQWLLPTARSLTKERNGFAGVLVATIKVTYFDQLWASLALDSGSTIGLFRGDGQLLMRSPIDGTAMGRSFSDSPLFLQHLPASANGIYRINSRIDGLDRFIAYRTLGQRPDLVVFAGRTVEAVLAPWYLSVKLMVGMWLVGSLTLLVLAVRLSRQSAHRQRAENTSAALAQRLNAACEAAGLVLWDWNLRSDQWHVTPTFYTTLGYPAQSALVVRTQWQDLVHPDDRNLPRMDPAFLRSHPDPHYDYEVRMRHADGSYRWMRTTGQVKECDAQGHPVRMIGIRIDVTERVNAEHERHQMFERISDALVGISTDWTITHANARAGQLLGHSVHELVGKNIWSIFPDSGGHRFRPVYERCMASQRPEVFEEHFEPTGVWYESHIYPSPEGLSVYFRDITDRKRDEEALIEAKVQAENLINGANVMVVGHGADGNVSNYIGTFSDITEQRAVQERIDWLSHFDSLTQLPNRELFADRGAHDISLAQRDGKPLSMMVLNMDHFKHINETLGYGLGNRVIKKFARRLVKAVRAQDTVGRLGADEFALVLPGETPEGAALLAEHLQVILSEPIGIADQEANVNLSIGIAVYPSDGADADALLKAASVAMHQAKARGGNGHRFYSAEMFTASTQRMAISSALHNAIHAQQLQLHYQPFVDLQTGQIVGMEALLRWTHPELGAVSPATFIPLAEQSGQILAIGAWVLRRACADMQLWRSQGLAIVPVSVNLSPLQFRDPGLLDTVRTTLQAHAIEPGQICLELTEGAVMDDVAHSAQQMRALKDIGVTLSLDDFGTGYSSLSYLKRFPFDKVKIDQSFVRDINSNNQDAVIAKVVISMAHGLGLRVIAEGVENELQCEFLRSNVCDEIQGYFFSRPIPAPAMEALLREDRRLPAHLVRVQTKQRTLLLVDDEPNVLAALKRLLRSDGYRILSASSGQEGLDVLASQAVDIIVSDQRMPGMTGVQFLRQAKALHPQTIRIVLSGHTELQSVTDAINEGAVYRFLTKPWDDVQLREFIEQAFHHKELADENEMLNIKILTANQELATSNRQLQEVLEHKQRALVRGEQNLDVLREALMYVDLPVLAIDDDGVVAFANARADELCRQLQPLLGNKLADCLPSLDILVGSDAPQGGQIVTPEGRPYQARWHAMGSASNSRGKVITLIPVHAGDTA